ncbi:uncharacterized protein LOC129457225 [Periophthalmus magnuspinnatus]|uniref:uncharacterized protein LOC129457225 n=1 Tax=Periophthalmus magnuspinnatus TaxID=409849 RepID=UPI0024365AAF|nr:uncharacterized protein LOC129457225 [Periophthalmus magnuspinnatus]
MMEEGSAADPGVQACRGRCEVGVQWEEPENQYHDVGVQSDTQWCDVAVQVDLIGLSCRARGSSDVPWRCLSLHPEQTEEGALWNCCAHVLQSSPALNQSCLRLPSLPSCGDSPSSHQQGESWSATPEPEGAEIHAPYGFMAPLSSDEEEPNTLRREDEQSTNPPIKKRRGCPKNSASLSNPETTATPTRRSKTGRAAGLPLRYLLDYDLESHVQLTANKQQPESGKGAGPGTKREDKSKSDKKVLILPYYKQPLNLEEFTEIQNVARQYKALQEEDDWPNSTSIIVHPALEQFRPCPLSQGEILELNKDKKPRLLPMKLKKVKDDVKFSPPASKISPDWLIENAAIKEEPDLESSDLFKTKIKRIEVKGESDLSFVIKQEDVDTREGEVDFTNSKKLKDGILSVKSQKKDTEFGNSDAPKTGVNEVDEAPMEVKRKRGRPKKKCKKYVEISQEEVIFKEDSELSVAEQLDRPRRVAVGPPIRYLLESEKLSPGRQERLKLGDVLNGDADKAGMVKKVKILNGNADHAEGRSWINSLESVPQTKYEYEEEDIKDIKDIYVLREDEYTTRSQSELAVGDRLVQWDKTKKDLRIIETGHVRSGADSAEGQWERWTDGSDGEWANERRRRVRRKKCRRNLKMDLDRKVTNEFLVFRDNDTNAVTLIPPCSVKLQKLLKR